MKMMNLNNRLDQMDRHGKSANSRRSGKKKWARLLVVLLILVIAILIPARGIYAAVKDIKGESKALSEDFKNQNLDKVQGDLSEMESSASSLDHSLIFLFWLRIIPFVSGYYSDAKGFSSAIDHELRAGKILVKDLEPYKQELGFNGTPTPGQDRVAQMVKILDKTLPNLDQVEPELKAANDDVSSIDTTKYPEQFSKYRLRSEIDTTKNFIIGAYLAVTQAKPALEIAPSALGEPEAKNYLILFQNDKELRATGGFLTAYAFIRIDKGHVSATASDDIYRLDEKLLSVCQNKVCNIRPPAPIVKYLPEANGKPRTAWSMRDSNLSPDLPTSMKQFETMFSLLGQGTPWDGIITIDTEVVRQMIAITGPVEVEGTKYSADIDPRCNCPNVVYELEGYSEIVAKGQSDRKAILGTLMQQILGKALTSGTDKLPQFINTGAQLAAGKHMMFYMHDQKTQDALTTLNWTGMIKQADNDYLHVNDSNFAGGKSNLYVTEDVNLDIDKSSGKHKLVINYSNPQSFGIWLNAINRDYLRIYVPQGSKLTSSKGSDEVVNTIDSELGKTVFEAFLQVRPQNSRTIEFDYTTPKSDYGNPYSILIQKQPGTKDFKYTVKVNGKTKTFDLSNDQDLKI